MRFSGTPSGNRIAPGDRIPFGQKLAFSFGASTDYIAVGMTIGVLWMPYFNIGLGFNPAKVGIVLMILQGWNAIIDPVIGNLSDNARTPWGRRRPFMVAGSILTAVFFLLLWRPPGRFGETGELAWVTVTGLVFFVSYSLWAMPYYGMQLELTPDYDERTRLNAWTGFFGKVTSLISGWVMAIIAGPWFVNSVTHKPDIVAGLRACSWYIAGFILLCGLLPALFVRERYYQADTSHQSREPLWKSIKESVSCGPLWLLIGITFFLVLGCSAVGTLLQYLNIYYVMHGDIAEASVINGWKASALMMTGIACIPLWTWLSEKFDKKKVILVMIGATALGHLLNYFLLNPRMPYLQLLSAVLESGAISAIWLLLPSMKADVADYDELGTTRRREGSLNAFYSWFYKAAMTCALGLGGFLLAMTKFDSHKVMQSPEVLSRMFWIYLLLPLVLWGCAALFVLRYPLTRERMWEIRLQLEARRGRL